MAKGQIKDSEQHVDSLEKSHFPKDKENFYLERYKYILGEIKSLNDNVHKYISLFQALSTAIVGAGVYVLINYKSQNIQPEIAKISLKGLYWLLTSLSLFVIFQIVSGVFTWIDYRNEEVDFLENYIGKGIRRRPNFSSFWRWHETYLIAFVIVITGLAICFTEWYIIPNIR